jgi:hypothetical protein
MDDNNTIKLKAHSSETSRNDVTGETICVYTLAKSLTPEIFASLLDDFLNLGGKGYREGREVGLHLRFTHRTLQRLVICFVFGMIIGFSKDDHRHSEQEYTDARNETAIQTAKKVKEMIDQGELPFGFYIRKVIS